MSKTLDPDFLAEYERAFLFFGGWVWIPKRDGREWIASCVKRHNPRRRGRQAASATAANQLSP
jgi:hypothetical protein